MTTIVVPPRALWGDDDSLQAFVARGMAAADAGSDATVLVPPGRYRESISIRKAEMAR